MIAKSYIQSNLQSLDWRYRKAKSGKDALFCSKLAILELCGWIEESMDDIVQRCSVCHLKVASNRKYCKDEIIKRTHGFDYHRNFRFMLIRLLGLVGVEKLERQLNSAKYDSMISVLESLKSVRDAEAHTHLKGTTRRLDAPSVTLNQFRRVYDGLMEFDRVIRRCRWGKITPTH